MSKLSRKSNLLHMSTSDPALLLEGTGDVSSEGGSGLSRRAMNSTAYRIFKLLQWLMESPMSVDQLNTRFCEDPRIGKPVSSDSIWLYINTLKELGCRIRRPSLRNGFCYEMQSHPFGLTLHEAQLETLAQAKAYAQRSFSAQEMLVLDGLLKKIVAYSACDDPKLVVDRLFLQSRSFDYGDNRAHIEILENMIERGQLLWLRYHSPRHGPEEFHFLPTLLFYEQGVVYLRGERPGLDEPSNLRVDRLLSATSVDNLELSAELLERTEIRTEVVLHLLPRTPEAFIGLHLAEHQGVYAETLQWMPDLACYEVRLQVRELFYIKQRLLTCGWPFRILSPGTFRQDVAQTLEAMLEFYNVSGGLSDGPV